MKVIIKPNSDKELKVISNLETLGLNLKNPLVRFGLRSVMKTKTQIPKQYRRAALNFSIDREGDLIIYSMSQTIPKGSENKILFEIDNLIKSCDGEPENFEYEVLR